jgi:hypothetical protein
MRTFPLQTFKCLGALLLFSLIALALSSCGQKALSVAEYHSQVLSILKSSSTQPDATSANTGFASMISVLIDDLGCMGRGCTLAIRFQHMRELAQGDRPALASYRGQLCGKDLHPPTEESETHQNICNAILQILEEVGGIESTSNASLKLFPTTEGQPIEPSVEIALEGASTNLARSQQKIREANALLEKISWLQPVLPDIH